MNILIVGGGRQVYFLCRDLLGKDHKLTVIDSDDRECRWLSRRLERAVIVRGDGSDPRILEDAGCGAMDVVLAMTGKDEVNLAVCQAAALRFKAPRVLSPVIDPDNEDIFRALGVEGAFSPTPALIQIIEGRAGLTGIMNMLPAAQGEILVTELVLAQDSPALDTALKDLDIPDDCLLACVVRQGRVIVPRGGTMLRAGDQVLVITRPETHEQALKALTRT